VSNTWKHLGFQETSEEQLAAWDVEDRDLVHMQNTLQVGAAQTAAGGLAQPVHFVRSTWQMVRKCSCGMRRAGLVAMSACQLSGSAFAVCSRIFAVLGA
jgi:hypothetical protein